MSDTSIVNTTNKNSIIEHGVRSQNISNRIVVINRNYICICYMLNELLVINVIRRSSMITISFCSKYLITKKRQIKTKLLKKRT